MQTSSQFETECEVFTALCWKIGTPVAWRALCALRRRDWRGLVSIKVRPADYQSPKCYLEDAQIAAFFKKFPGFDLGYDLDEAAERSFFEAEASCFQTNERLSPLFFELTHYGELHARVIRAWREKVKIVLGRVPSFSCLQGRFGPGSTFQNRGDDISVAHKLSDGYTRTELMRSFLHIWDETAWSRYAACGLDVSSPDSSEPDDVLHHGRIFNHLDSQYCIRDFSVVKGNRFTTVPKDATKHRGICIEPSLNVFYQLAIGELISNRMRKVLGWDKSSCEAYHKGLARIGSLTGAVATIDLSSASDSICTNLVRLVLPPAWFRLLCQLRSPFTFIGGKWVRLEKFSSMGNGFTFELETLLFWTLSLAVQEIVPSSEDPFTPGLVTSVYGDDIIVPTSVSRNVIAALNFFGFTTNDTKTFVSGKFRESCGGDFFDGKDVRPFYLKKVLDAPSQLITLANGLRRFGHRHDDLGGFGHFRSAWFRTLDSIPRQIRRCRGPEALGDLVIHDEESRWSVTIRNSIRYLRVWRPVPNRAIGWDNFRPGVVLASALYGTQSGSPSLITSANPEGWRRSGFMPRIKGSYVSGYRFGRVAYS